MPYVVDGRHPGRWSPGGARLLGLSGPIERSQLRRLLEGRDPQTGADLPIARRADRCAGWGFVFSAPKSVSLMAAVEPGAAGAQVAAVDSVLSYLESRLQLKRRDSEGRMLRADGLLAASFDHTTNAASEPHLHTHVVVANLSRSGQKWGTLHSADWRFDRLALGALFDLELRRHLGDRGWPLEWRLRPDGLADVADVPRAAVRAASSQGRRAATAGRFAARASATPQPWAARTAEAGFVPSPLGPGGSPSVPPSMDDPQLERAVGLRLTSRRSDFRRADVIETLAGCWPGGASVDAATAWADRFCDRSLAAPSPTSQPRWATSASRRLDHELVRDLTGRRSTAFRASEEELDHVVADAPYLSETAVSGVRALVSGSPVGIHFLGSDPGRSDLLAQAEMIATARPVWERAGLRVAVTSPDQVGDLRWGVLTGVPTFRPGDRVDVLVVDRADRRPTPDLLRMVRAHEGELVFIEGGTLPRLTSPASRGMTEAGDHIGRRLSGPHPTWGTPTGVSRAPGLVVGRSAVDGLLHEWRAAADESVLVALGIEEIRGLNRAVVGSERPPRGPERFEPGDRVVALRSGPGLPPFGTFGTVRGLTGTSVEFEWADGGRTITSDGRALAAVDFGYAVSPRVAALSDRPLRVLGPAAAITRGRERVVSAIEVSQEGRRREQGLEPGL